LLIPGSKCLKIGHSNARVIAARLLSPANVWITA
jgi:hypothetical protein